ncbi:MAG TPA: aromatic-ring-hydroxylating dioxygenase subunit beta, partial [Hyphomicrobiales bacterium]|nr:aromatic-ring-hydroxylating dioxygenase subunit beta [Hyphomicrobiales bacterium]
MIAQHDPSLTSHYVGNEFYEKLVADFADWRREERESDDPALRDSCRRLLEREARLLEELRLDDWLALYAPECLYWVPTTPDGGDPRREVAVAFDDRRRLEDRVYRLQLAHAWSQRPPSR